MTPHTSVISAREKGQSGLPAKEEQNVEKQVAARKEHWNSLLKL